MSRDDQRAALFFVLVDCSVEYVVQSIDFALKAATVLNVDDWILRRGENIACDDHVGAPEMHKTVTVGYCGGFPERLDAFIVVILSPAALQERVGRPSL